MDNMNQPAPQQGAPMTDMTPHKKGYGPVTTIVVLLLLILAAYLLWPKNQMDVPGPTTATPGTEQGTQAQAEDLNSLEADLDATNIDGVSNSL